MSAAGARTVTWVLSHRAAYSLGRSISSTSASVSAPVEHAAPPPPPPPPSSGLAALTSRRLISIAGPDAARYLQGAVTANVLSGDGGGPRTDPFVAAFLSARGRILADVFVFPRAVADDNFLLDVDAARAAWLEDHIRRYRLRARFDIRLLGTTEATVWQAWRHTDQDDIDGVALYSQPRESPGPQQNQTDKGSELVLRDPRAPALGHRLVTLGGSLTATATAAGMGLELVPEAAYRVRRYLAGVGEGEAELGFDEELPLSYNLDLSGAIHFAKGCYVGQELTVRTQHRGVVRKRLLPCALYPAGAAPPDALEYDPASRAADRLARGAAVGRLGKPARDPAEWVAGVGNVGLALCRLAVMTDILLPGEKHQLVAETAGAGVDEFVVGDSVRVKAFMPAWMRARLAAHQGGL